MADDDDDDDILYYTGGTNRGNQGSPLPPPLLWMLGKEGVRGNQGSPCWFPLFMRNKDYRSVSLSNIQWVFYDSQSVHGFRLLWHFAIKI